MSRWTASVSTCAALAAALLAGVADSARAANLPADEEAVIVVEKAPATGVSARERLRTAAATAGLELVRRVPEIGAASVDLPARQTVGELRKRLARDPRVAAVEANLRFDLRAAPSDPAYVTADPEAPGGDTYQWHLRRSGFERAWNRSSGARATVAVIDSGADASHPDVGPRVEGAFDYDDSLLHGGAERDENGHGTHVSGLACGQSDDGFGIASAGFRCRLLIYKSDLTIMSVADALVDASKRGADVVNMSFGTEAGEQSEALQNALERAYAADVVLVAAASNKDVDEDDNPTEDQGIPARYLQPIGTGPRLAEGTGLVVTAAQHDGGRAWFGPGRGSGISMAAYGSAGPEYRGIFSAFPEQSTELETTELCIFCRGNLGGDDRFAYLEGTSMAAPQVAGAAALIRDRKPRMSAARVIYLLKRKATRSGGFSDELGWGILNANKAVRAALKKKKKKK